MRALLDIRIWVDLALETITQTNVLRHMKGGDANSHLADISVTHTNLNYTRMDGKNNMKTNLTLTTMTQSAFKMTFVLPVTMTSIEAMPAVLCFTIKPCSSKGSFLLL